MEVGNRIYSIRREVPPSILQYVQKTVRVQSVENHLYDRDQVKKLLMNNLIKARDKMKKFVDRHRMERNFELGEMVSLKLQPYRQNTARGAHPQKLSLRYFGSYRIVEKIGQVAYKPQFPPSAKIHNVFYVSQLKRFKGKEARIRSDPPSFWEV